VTVDVSVTPLIFCEEPIVVAVGAATTVSEKLALLLA
jgi:hypothetical protein